MDGLSGQFLARDFQEILGHHHVLDSPHGAREIAYRKIISADEAGLFLIPGFGGNIWEVKPTFFAKKSLEANTNFLTFTYSGLEAPGRIVNDCSLPRWINDTKIMFRLTAGPQIIIASSFGATAAFHLALEHPDRVAGIVLVAPGTDLEKHMVHALLGRGRNRDTYANSNYFLHEISSPSGGRSGKVVKVEQKTILEARLEEVSRREEVRRDGKIKVSCPVIVIHSEDDTHIPISASEELIGQIESPMRPVLVRTQDAGHFHDQKESDLERLWQYTDILLRTAARGKLLEKAL